MHVPAIDFLRESGGHVRFCGNIFNSLRPWIEVRVSQVAGEGCRSRAAGAGLEVRGANHIAQGAGCRRGGLGAGADPHCRRRARGFIDR
jgi:hypothetical protein